MQGREDSLPPSRLGHLVSCLATVAAMAECLQVVSVPEQVGPVDGSQLVVDMVSAFQFSLGQTCLA